MSERPTLEKYPRVACLFAGLLAMVLAAGCSSGSGGGGRPPGDFIVIRSDPANNAQLFLNQSVAWEFSGVVSGPDGDVQSGFVGVVDDNVGGVRIDYPTVIGGLEVASIKIDVPYCGQSVIEVTLRNASAKLGADHNRYSHYVASVVESGATLGQLRILGHTGSTLYLSTESGTLPAFTAGVRAIQVNVLEKFFDIFTNGVEGFPQAFKGRDGDNERIPRSNVRIDLPSTRIRRARRRSDIRRWRRASHCSISRTGATPRGSSRSGRMATGS